MKNLSLEIDGKMVNVIAQRINGVVWVYMNKKILTFKPKKRIKAGQTQDASSEKNIVAPMPGKLIKVLVKVGDEVDVNQTVAVMEAMKMEYQLKAVKKSVVKSVAGGVGDQIPLGQVIVELEPIVAKI